MITELNFSGRKRLPVILQTEAMECGLASLTMIAKYHGHDVDLNGMRQKFSVSLKGAALDAIIDMAAALDLGSRALRLELEHLPQLQLPAILHWDLNHYVVLKKVVGDKVHIHDPALGLKIMSLKKFSEHFTGVALELTPTTNFTKQTAKEKMRLAQLWGRLVGFKRALLQLLILSVVMQLIVLASPFYLQLVVDEAVVKFDAKFLLVLALGFGALTVIQQIASMMREWTILYYGHQMSFQMVANIFKHLIHLPTDFFEKRHIGDILSRMASTNPIQTALTQSVVAGIIDGLMAVITGIVIFIYSPLLGIIVLASVVLLLLVTTLFYPILRRTQEETIITGAKENTHMIESIRASTPIKLFSAQNHRISIWRNLFADTVNANVAHGKYGIWLNTLQGLITGLQTILVVYFGAKLILSGEVIFTVGMLFAFMSYRQSFTNSVTSLFNKFIEFRLLGLHLERIADIAHSVPETTALVAPTSHADEVTGHIQLRDIRFRYSPADPWVLDDINMDIKAGDFVALTGSSGSGKTTLFKDKVASMLEVSSQERSYLATRQNLSNQENNRLKVLAQVRDIEAQIVMLAVEQTAQENEIKSRISALEQSIIRTDSQGSLIIRSPVQGLVTTITARKGQATSAKPVMSILPQGGELLAELFVPARAAGFVKAGQPVRLLYDAFPYQKFGFFAGRVKQVSKTVVNTVNLTNAPQLPEPVFLVTVTLDRQFINTMGERFPLQAGMALSADLILEDRKIWEWAFGSLLGAMR